MTLPFFVYGTLRPGEVNHAPFLRGHTRSETPAHLTGALLYDGPGYPYAVEAPGGVVYGELVTALPDHYEELLTVLDRLEEYAPGDPSNLYERVAREVRCEGEGDGEGEGSGEVLAWVYLAAPPVAEHLRAHGKLIESGDWRVR